MHRKHTQLSIEKSEARGSRGMAATKHPLASAVAVEVLANGGSAADAAVAASFAIGVVEPWSSGIGGGGYAVVASADCSEVISFPMKSGSGAIAERYPLDGRTDVGGFLWNGVEGDANLHGYRAMAVPGAVAGLGLLHERHGRLPWRDLVLPAIALAREGFEIGWFDAGVLAAALPAAQRHPELQRRYYPGGVVPSAEHFESFCLAQPELAVSLEAIAHGGVEAFYQGDLAAAIFDDPGMNASVIERRDLAAYRARVASPLRSTYRDADVLVPGPGCAGPTTIQTLNIYECFNATHAGHASVDRLHAFLWSARLAYADRFQFMTDPDRSDGPWEALVSKAYARSRWNTVDDASAPAEPLAGDAWAFNEAARAVERLKSETSTTHLCTADADGLMVSLTNTLGGAWGSEVVAGGTGIVWNNGMWWFDPVPGRLNSVGPNRYGLNNMTPAIVFTSDGRGIALGASGGRRITNCVAQLVGNVVDHGLGAQDAVATPRVDASTPWVTVDGRFGDDAITALQQLGWDVRVAQHPGRSAFASPVLILRDSDGGLGGGVDVFHTAAAQGL